METCYQHLSFHVLVSAKNLLSRLSGVKFETLFSSVANNFHSNGIVWLVSINNKSAQSTDIPIRVLKENADIFADYICGFFNESIKKSTFPSILENANITPVFKKGYRSSKENYRPESILPVISKIFEKLLCK